MNNVYICYMIGTSAHANSPSAKGRRYIISFLQKLITNWGTSAHANSPSAKGRRYIISFLQKLIIKKTPSVKGRGQQLRYHPLPIRPAKYRLICLPITAGCRHTLLGNRSHMKLGSDIPFLLPVSAFHPRRLAETFAKKVLSSSSSFT